MNGKYLIKFEAGPYEQTYKVDETEINGLDGLKEKINDDVLQQIAACFRSMHALNPFKQ